MRKRKRRAKAAALCLLLSTLSGCWDATDIENRAVCTAVVVDREDDNYAFYVEVAVVESRSQNGQREQSEGQAMKTVIVKSSGKDFADARIDLDNKLNKPVFLGAVQSLILTERMADSGIEEYALRVRQMVDYRKTMDVIVTPENPRTLLEMHPEDSSTVGFAIEDTMQNIVENGYAFRMSLADLLQKLVSHNPCYLMSTLAVRDGQITLVGNTVFNGGKRLGFIPFEESRGIVYLTSREKLKPKYNYVVAADDAKFTMDVELKSRKIKALYDGEHISYTIEMYLDAKILYPNRDKPYTAALKEKLRNEVTAAMDRDVSYALALSKEYGDFMSLSEAFRIKYPDAYDQLDWNQAYQKAEINVLYSVDIKEGATTDYNPRRE